MSLRFDVLGKLAALTVCATLACSEDKPPSNGGTAGQASGGSPGSAGTSSGGSAGSSAGTSSGGMVGGSGASAGSSAGGGGSSSGGNAAGGNAAGGGTAGSSLGGSTGGGGGSGGAGSKSKTTFFVTSDTSKTGNLGGLAAADKRCQDLAVKAGIGDHTFRAYLSTAAENAKDRIGKGPWVNAKGVTLAADLAALHASTLKGDPTLFIDENGKEIGGQWNNGQAVDPSLPDSANKTLNEHDILTGSKADGTLQAGQTCKDWTSEAAADTAQVGHSDGMGPMQNTGGNFGSWNSVHASGSCAETWRSGGAGRIYCFAID